MSNEHAAVSEDVRKLDWLYSVITQAVSGWNAGLSSIEIFEHLKPQVADALRAHESKDTSELLADQRRTFCAEIDDLKAELKRVRKVALEQIEKEQVAVTHLGQSCAALLKRAEIAEEGLRAVSHTRTRQPWPMGAAIERIEKERRYLKEEHKDRCSCDRCILLDAIDAPLRSG